MKVLSFSQQGSRNYQQDNLYISEEKQIFAVCDGVGGSADGFLASNMVVNSLQSQYPGHATLHDKDSIGDYLFDVLSAFRHDQFEEIATTMTFLTIVGPTAFLYHIGGSRIFYNSPSRSKWYVTKDHSYVQELFEAGILTSENEMRTHPMRNRITKVISNTNPLTQQDIEHLTNDIKRAYNIIINEWIEYLIYLKNNYPYLYVSAVTINPFLSGFTTAGNKRFM